MKDEDEIRNEIEEHLAMIAVIRNQAHVDEDEIAFHAICVMAYNYVLGDGPSCSALALEKEGSELAAILHAIGYSGNTGPAN